MKKRNKLKNNILKKAFENIIFKIIQVILSSTKILWIYVNDKNLFFIYILKCLKIYQLNIIKKIAKGYFLERYQNHFKGEKEKKQQYGLERYKNLSEDENNKLVAYRKRYYRMRKNALL